MVDTAKSTAITPAVAHRRLPPADRQREPLGAMAGIARGGEAQARQWPSMGCSIKWRD